MERWLRTDHSKISKKDFIERLNFLKRQALGSKMKESHEPGIYREEDYDRLVQGCEEFYFGQPQEPQVRSRPIYSIQGPHGRHQPERSCQTLHVPAVHPGSGQRQNRGHPDRLPQRTHAAREPGAEQATSQRPPLVGLGMYPGAGRVHGEGPGRRRRREEGPRPRGIVLRQRPGRPRPTSSPPPLNC